MRIERISRLVSSVGRDRSLCIMIAFAAVLTLNVGIVAIADHIGLRTQIGDLGHAVQAIWHITQGDFAMTVTDPQINASRLIFHANLIFYVLAIPYFFFPNPITLLVIAALSFGFGGIAMYFFAKTILKNNTLALLFGCAMLLNPLVQEAALYDFHSIILAIPLLILLLLCMERKKWIAFWICAILLLSVKEDMPLLLLFYTPLIFVRGSKKHSIILVVVCIAYWFFVSKGIEMIFGQAVGSDVNHRYGYLGRTPNEIVTTVITEPTKWLSTLRAPKQFAYLYYLFIQGLFMAVLSPLALLGAIPNIAQNTLSSLDFQKSLSGAYYSGIVITSIYIACLYSLRNRSSLFIKALLTAFIIQIFVITLVMSPLPYGIRNEWIEVMPTHRISSFKNMLSLIPDNAPVGTQNNLGAHLSERDFIVKYSHLFDQADYILLHTQIPLYKFNGPYFKAHRQLLSHSLDEFDTYSKNMFFKKDFGVLSYDPPFYLFKRDHPRTLNHTAYKSSLHHLKNLRYCADDTNAALNPCPDDPILPTSNPLKQ